MTSYPTDTEGMLKDDEEQPDTPTIAPPSAADMFSASGMGGPSIGAGGTIGSEGPNLPPGVPPGGFGPFGPPTPGGLPGAPKPPPETWDPGPGELGPGDIPPWGGPPIPPWGGPGGGGPKPPPQTPADPGDDDTGGGGEGGDGGPAGGGVPSGTFDPFGFNFPDPVPLPDRAALPSLPGQTPTPEAGPLNSDLEGFARNVLENPSRFDIGLVEDITEAINFELDRAGQAGYRRLDERMAQRGLTGSNIEAETGRRVAEDLNQDRLERLNALNMELARTAAQDRATAAGIGRGVNQDIFSQNMQRGRFDEMQRQFDANFGLNRSQLAEQQRQFDFNAQLQQRAQQLQQQGMKADEAYRRARMELENEWRQRGFDIEEDLAQNDQRMQALQLLLQAMSAGGVLGEDFIDALG